MRSPRFAGKDRLTAAAAVVVIPAAAMTIVVTPTATAIVVTKAGTTIVAVAAVPVTTPTRVPEFAGAPLRERAGLGLCDGSRSQTGQA